MPSFSKRSSYRLAQCHLDLRKVLNAAIEQTDFTVLCGHRGKDEQDAAVAAGNSRLVYPMSKHNQIPSRAVDIAPYPIDWDDISRFVTLGSIVLDIATKMGIDLVWGGNWKSLKDYPHYELRGINT